MKRISSRSTFYNKKIFPVIWFGTLGPIMVLCSFGLASGDMSFAPGVIVPAMMMIGGYMLLKVRAGVLDEVYDKGDSLLLRRGREEDEVSFADIIKVNYDFSPFVTVSLKRPCKFGSEVRFDRPLWLPGVAHPAITDFINRSRLPIKDENSKG